MKTHEKKAVCAAVVWIALLLCFAALSGCASQPDIVYTPSEVDKPVSVPCKPPQVVKPVDLLLALPASSSLTSGLKACLAQHDYDIGYQGQLEAALQACSQ